MSLDFYLEVVKPAAVYEANITHNLGPMAQAAGLYDALWRPAESGYRTAADVLPVLRAGIDRMKAVPREYRRYDSPNGWGSYDNFVPWLERLAAACEEYPEAAVRACV